MKNPLISIILPAYNAERFIGEAIESVARQSYPEWELIVVNDGSQDRTAGIAESWASDKRIRVLHQQNSGVSVARNSGLEVMRGDCFTFLDADDVLPAESLRLRAEKMVACPRIGMLAGGVAETDESGRVFGKIWRPSYEGNPLRLLARLDERVFFNPSILVRRNKNTTYRFRPGLTHCEDLLFFLSIAAQGPILYAGIDDVVYRYRRMAGTAMSDLGGLVRGYRTFFREVGALQNSEIRLLDKLYLRYRYVRILFLTSIRARDYRTAGDVLFDLIPWWSMRRDE